MKQNFLAGTALLVVIGASAANAADLAPSSYKAPAPAPIVAPSWTGFYIGGNVGGANTTGSWDANVVFGAGGSTIQNFHINKTGFLGGGQIGYNWQSGQAVFGVEADVAGADLKTSTSTNSDPFFANGFINGKGLARFSSEIDWLSTFRGRVGITATPALLLYVTGGAAAAGVKVKYENNNGNNNPAATALINTLSSSSTVWGWTAGAGAEHALGRNWSLKAEYLHVQLDNATINVPASLSNLNIGTLTAKQNIDLIRVGANYRF